MPAAVIPFGNHQASGLAELAGASPLAINVCVDDKGAVRRRPVLTRWSGFPTALPEDAQIDGLTSTAIDTSLYYVTDTRRIWQLTAGVATEVSSLATATTLLDGTARPVFADTAFRLVVAGGLAPQQVYYSVGVITSARLGGSPPNSTNMAALGSRLFCDDNTSSSTVNLIRISGSGSTGNEVWDALNYVTAEARPDDIVAMRENTNEMFVFGETTLQVFSADPVAIIAPGRTLNIGCSAAHSVVRVDEQFAWLDEQRQFVISDGRQRNTISDPIAGTLDSLATVSDCYGYRVNTDQFDCLVWTFPTDGRTYCYQVGGGWSQWQGWTYNYGYEVFPATSHHYWPTQNLHLVGTADGRIAQLSADGNEDISGPCRAEVRTGFLNRDTDARKDCQSVKFVFKRGQTTTAGKAYVSWRDDLGAFSDKLEINLGATGDYMPTVEFRTLGVYRQRQWLLEMTDAVDLTLARAEETYAVLTD